MIETQYETPFGIGRVLLYNQRSVRFWSQARYGHGITINKVVYDIDISLTLKDEGTWEIGYYENDNRDGEQYKQRSWRRGYMDIVRSDWVHTGNRCATDSAREKAETILPGLVKFIAESKQLRYEAELDAARCEVARHEAQVQTKREELKKAEDILTEAKTRLAQLEPKAA